MRLGVTTSEPVRKRKRFHINSVPLTDKALESWTRTRIIIDDDAALLRRLMNERSSSSTRNKIIRSLSTGG